MIPDHLLERSLPPASCKRSLIGYDKEMIRWFLFLVLATWATRKENAALVKRLCASDSRKLDERVHALHEEVFGRENKEY